MKQFTSRNRKQLKNKMAEALSDNIKELPVEMQDMLLDDLITAFQSRYEVLIVAELDLYCFVNPGVKVQNATIKA